MILSFSARLPMTGLLRRADAAVPPLRPLAPQVPRRARVARVPATGRVWLYALWLAAYWPAAHAHDTWLVPAADAAAQSDGEQRFELATGNRFPVAEVATDPASLIGAQCADAGGRKARLRAVRTDPRWLLLAYRAPWRGGPAQSCWLELKAYDVEVEPPLVQTYFQEIRAPQAVRDTWAAMLSRGMPWQETFRKFARTELAEARALTPEQRERLRQPVGHALEIVILGGEPVGVGNELRFRVLRDGQPLPNFPVEFVNDQNPLGVWRQSDDKGEVSLRLPFAGRWVLRGTDLRLDERNPARWQSRFVTLLVEAR